MRAGRHRKATLAVILRLKISADIRQIPGDFEARIALLTGSMP
jgi:hypothetical protein